MRYVAATRWFGVAIAGLVALAGCHTCPDDSPGVERFWREQLEQSRQNIARVNRVEIELSGEFPGFEPPEVKIGPIVVTDPDIIAMIQREIARLGAPSFNKHLLRKPLSGPDARFVFICREPYSREIMSLNGSMATFLQAEKFDAMSPDTALKDEVRKLGKAYAEQHPESVVTIGDSCTIRTEEDGERG